MKIEYDKFYKSWVIWKVEGSGLFEMYKNKSKQKCNIYFKKNQKRGVK